MSTEKWDERYKAEPFAYGKEPNLFFKEWLLKFNPGTILMPADGEGRNGVYAAESGWSVTSFDQSSEGRSKALQLADEKSVSLEYTVGNFEDLTFGDESFDAIGLVYAHFEAGKKSNFHKKLNRILKPGGIIIFEAFAKGHINFNGRNPSAGGPKDFDTLYSRAEILADFHNYEILLLEEATVELHEGQYHNGESCVIRFVGRKKHL